MGPYKGSVPRRTKPPTLETIQGWHRRYNEIEDLLSSIDRDASPALVCDLEIELVGLAERIAANA